MNSRTQRLHAIGKKTLLELHGFYTEKSESTVCGNGVFIRGGRAEAGTLVSLYPGMNVCSTQALRLQKAP